MKLNKSLEGKKVKIIDIDGDIYIGEVTDYIYPEDNEPEGIAGINLYDPKQKPSRWIGLNEDDILSIEVL